MRKNFSCCWLLLCIYDLLFIYDIIKNLFGTSLLYVVFVYSYRLSVVYFSNLYFFFIFSGPYLIQTLRGFAIKGPFTVMCIKYLDFPRVSMHVRKAI